MDTFRTVLRKTPTTDTDGPAVGASSAEAAWLVLEAANDLGDAVAVAACRRLIDASLNGKSAAQPDVNLVQSYTNLPSC
jgi:hypothetical protein